jgi:hypothetical protein
MNKMNAEKYLKEKFPEPSEVKWIRKSSSDEDGHDFEPYWDCEINNVVVATVEKRPHYCDRGHFYVKCYLYGLDESDRFPRYYMREDIAKAETESFLKWRLWKQRGDKSDI